MVTSQRVKSEQALIGVLTMVTSQIAERKFNGQRRSVFLSFLKSVDFRAITLANETYKDLIVAFRAI